MANIRVLPPNTTQTWTLVVSGRTYTSAAGAPLDVPDFDAPTLLSNGWCFVSPLGVGATAARPATPGKWQPFFDTTLGYEIFFDGKQWRSPITGGSV